MSGIHNQESLEEDVLATELEHAKLKDMQQTVQWCAADIIITTQQINKITDDY